MVWQDKQNSVLDVLCNVHCAARITKAPKTTPSKHVIARVLFILRIPILVMFISSSNETISNSKGVNLDIHQQATGRKQRNQLFLKGISFLTGAEKRELWRVNSGLERQCWIY